MEEPYRTDQAIYSTRVGSNGSDNEPITKAFHRIAIVSKSIQSREPFGQLALHTNLIADARAYFGYSDTAMYGR